MALQGSLSELSLPDVIQLVAVSGKTGAFHVTRGDTEGEIYLTNGQITDARVGDLRGEHAVYEMAIWSEGDFRFEPGVVSAELTVRKSNANLMMEAARRMDEWRVLSRKIPSLDLVPVFPKRDRNQDQVTLSPQEWILVTRIDGRSSIEEIAKELRWAAFDVSKLLFGMVTSGLVELMKPGEGGGGEGYLDARPSPITLLGLAEKIRKMALSIVGADGEKSIEEQYQSTRTRIEHGDGMNAIRTMIEENGKAISKLKGADVAEMFAEEVQPLLGEEAAGPVSGAV
ncbi:MAG: DUF4388 domain-containing protein [Acidobacteria bacterium]|nr:DUF4388 domain-containing protein [Acidobacteriota bacterium]